MKPYAINLDEGFTPVKALEKMKEKNTNLVTKVSEPDVVSYVKSLDIFLPLKHSQAHSSVLASILKIITRFPLRPSNFPHVAGGPEVLLFSLTVHSCLLSHLSNVLMTIIMTGIKISKAAVGLDKDLIFVAVYVQPWCVCLCVVEVIDLAWWTFPVRCRCGPSSLSGPHSDTGLPFPLVNVAALLSLVVLLFAAGFHSSTSALASPSVLLVAAVAGLSLIHI